MIVGVVAVLLLLASSAGAAPRPSFGTSVTDYAPATIAGRKVVFDPRSTTGTFEDVSCEIPPGGYVSSPVPISVKFTQEFLGGVWVCTTPDQAGTGFVVGLDATQVPKATPKLTKKFITDHAQELAPIPAELGAVKTTKIKVGGLPLTVFVFSYTFKNDSIAGPAGTAFDSATTEPRKHVFVTATAPEGVDPLPALRAMLKAGAGATPRAG